MLDQCHNIEEKIPGQIRSVLNVQEMTARALLVDATRSAAAQRAGDVLAANAVFMDAFYTDVRPTLADWREERGLPRDPMAAYLASRATTSTSTPTASAARRPAGAPDDDRTRPSPSCSPGRTGSAPTRGTRTTPAATRPPRAPSIDPATGDAVELLWVKGSGATSAR